MQSENRTLTFDAKLINFEKLNDKFTKAKCYILTTGKNEKKTYISEKAANDAYYSLLYVPVIGRVKKDNKGNFILGGHDCVLDRSTLELKSLCIPFGVAIPSPEPTWEVCTEADGSEKPYLVTDVILWTGRFPELEDVKFSEEFFCNQSMEINVKDAQPYNEDTSYTEILSFTFDALCMLNKSDDRYLNVEPCFPSASIVKADFSLDNNNFSEMLNEMKQELKSYFAANNRGNIYLEKLDNKNDVVVSFSTTYREKESIICTVLRNLRQETRDEEGKLIEERCYYLNDFDDNYIFFTEDIYTIDGIHSEHFRTECTYDDETKDVIFDIDDAKKVSMVWLTDEEKAALDSDIKKLKGENDALTIELADYKETHSTTNDEVEELKSYKADNEAKNKKEEIDSILEEFEEVIGNTEEFVSLKENADNLSADELKEKLYVVAGKFAIANAKTQEKFQNEKVAFSKLPIDDSAKKNNDNVAYGGIVEKYCGK